MSGWSAGYVADIGYTFGYYAELNPLRAKFAFLSAGLALPTFQTGCELGFGQGVSVNFHAAASTVKWFGTDFNPAQAAFAQEMARAPNAGVHLYDDAFAEFAVRPELPDFDFIALHGIWSWISDENRALLVDFVRRKLKTGGVLYLSYNALPGWATFSPVRHLMAEHASVLGTEGHGIAARVNGALDFAEKLFATKPTFLKANPHVRERLEMIKGQSRPYLAHEYFNRDWHPMYFSDIANWLSPAKLQFASSAHFIDHVDGVNFTPDQSDLLKEIPDAILRESVKDFMLNQQFRRDYWVKGARRINAIEQTEQFRQLRIVLVVDRSDISLRVKGNIGEVALTPQIYEPIIDALSDFKAKSIGELEHALKGRGISFNHLLQAVLMILGQTWAIPANDEGTTAEVQGQCDRINAYILQRARGSSDVGHLVSSVTGGGIAVPRSAQLFLLALKSGNMKPIDWVDVTLQSMQAQGQKLLKAGRPIEDNELRAELSAQAQVFAEKQLPVLRALRVAV